MPRQPKHCDLPPDFNPETAPPTLTIDWEAYLPFLEDEDIPEDQKRALIEALWGIMVSFVDLGFGVHPSDRTCGEASISLPVARADVLPCDQPERMTSNSSASHFSKVAGKES